METQAGDRSVADGKYFIKILVFYAEKCLADQKKSRIYSFTEAVRNEGKLPGKKQLSLEKKEADAYLADKLQIEEGEEIFEIRSLYYADGIPYSLNTAVLPAKRFEKLDFFDFNNRSLYEVLGSFYGTYMYRVRQRKLQQQMCR